MNFFKSVFSTSESPSESPSDSFETLMKTFASKSESFIQTYRRDLAEFKSGLQSETSSIRSLATRAVRDLPSSLESTASAAQQSLESVGQAIDDFGGSVWRGTAEIISESRDAFFAVDSDVESHQSDPKRYSRFEAQVLAAQEDASTFAEEPEDAEDFVKWVRGFKLEEKEEEIEMLCYESASLEAIFERLVPDVVDYGSFWARYFYKVYKLKQAEEVRAKIVKRAMREDEDEDLSWEVDDDDDEIKGEEAKTVNEEKNWVDTNVIGLGHEKFDGAGKDLSFKAKEDAKMENEEKSWVESVEEREEKVDANVDLKRFDGVGKDLSFKDVVEIDYEEEEEEEEEEKKIVNKEKSWVESVEEEEKVDTNDVELVHEKKFDGVRKDLSFKAIAAIDTEEEEAKLVKNEKTRLESVEERKDKVDTNDVELGNEKKFDGAPKDLNLMATAAIDTEIAASSVGAAESRKDGDISFVSNQITMPVEEDLGWDEIEDLGEYDDKKVGGISSTTNKVDLHKKLSVLEEDEDLTWEIEDDD